MGKLVARQLTTLAAKLELKWVILFSRLSCHVHYLSHLASQLASQWIIVGLFVATSSWPTLLLLLIILITMIETPSIIQSSLEVQAEQKLSINSIRSICLLCRSIVAL